MAEVAVRVALLARPGDARDQLRRALAELGAELVAEGDPAELDPGEVAGHSPRAVLVSLEPAIEDALERFDDLLGQPGVAVIYDDAEVTRELDGWDLARWARHLAAKLVGSDVLPPVPGDADPLPQMDFSRMEPGAPPTPSEVMADARLEDYASESVDLSEWVPTQPKLSEEPRTGEVSADGSDAPDDDADLDLDIDLASLELALAGDNDADTETAPAPEEGREPDFGSGLELQDGESLTLDDELSLDADQVEAPEGFTLADAPEDEPLLADMELADGPVNFSSFSEEDAPLAETLDDDVAALAAQLEAFEASDQRQQPKHADFELGFDDPGASPPAESPAPAPAPEPKRSGFGGFGNLELAPMDDAPLDVPVEVAFAAPTTDAGEKRGSRLSLADQDAAPSQSMHAGALLVLAGLGGPDAVRQLLAALPGNLPLPVLLYQHLDTGKHDRLVGQLAKASQMPVDLALEGKLAFPGRVVVLPPDMGARRDGGNLIFGAGGLADVLDALLPAESGVLVLSGADPSLVPAVIEVHAAGGLVLAQDPSGCFDATAAEAVARAGAASGAPADLAARVAERWH